VARTQWDRSLRIFLGHVFVVFYLAIASLPAFLSGYVLGCSPLLCSPPMMRTADRGGRSKTDPRDSSTDLKSATKRAPKYLI
jgi:hypothetical protein